MLNVDSRTTWCFPQVLEHVLLNPRHRQTVHLHSLTRPKTWQKEEGRATADEPPPTTLSRKLRSEQQVNDTERKVQWRFSFCWRDRRAALASLAAKIPSSRDTLLPAPSFDAGDTATLVDHSFAPDNIPVSEDGSMEPANMLSSISTLG